MRKAKVMVSGSKFEGLIGRATEVNDCGNVMFYPKECKPVYRVCLSEEEIVFLE